MYWVLYILKGRIQLSHADWQVKQCSDSQKPNYSHLLAFSAEMRVRASKVSWQNDMITLPQTWIHETAEEIGAHPELLWKSNMLNIFRKGP